MASPFRVFRKNVKPLLVIFGVMLIVVFLIGDYVGYLSGSGGRGEGGREAGATAVSWDGGSLSNAEVDNLVVRRRITNEFLQHVEGLGQQSVLAAGIEPRPLRVQRLLGAELPQQGVEQDVVRTKLFADAARDAGMQVTDDAVVQYLVELGRGNVTRDEMRAILGRMQSSGWRVSIQFIIDALREEMLARNYVASHRFAFETVTPAQRWEDWRSVNDRVVVEAAAIPVESFLVDVPEPTAANLEAFFDEHREREPQPDPLVYRRYNVELPMPVPGFAIPRKIDVQYIEANFDEFLAKVENEITDEEIAEYYEDNKELFIKADTGLIDEPSHDQVTPPADESQAPGTATEETPATEPGDTAVEGTATDATTETESTDAPPPLSEIESESDQVPEATPATEPAVPADEGDEDDEPAEGDQSSIDGTTSKSAFRLAAFLQEADATAESESTPGESATDAAVDAAGKPNEESAPPAAAETPGAGDDSAAVTSAADAAPETPTTTAPPEEKPKEYQPLEEVSDLIRREMAGRRVADQMKDLMDQFAGELKGEFDKYIGQVYDSQSQNQAAPAPPPALADLASLAEKHGLRQGSTGPMSALEMRETPVGKSTRSDTGAVMLLDLFTSGDLDPYQPVLTHDVNGNRYLMMKTSDTPGHVPKLVESSDEVERAWKRQQAATKALNDAKEHAKKAQDERATLADYFADNQSIQVVRTDPFSELTGGEVAIVQGEYRQQPFRLSQPDGIVAPGPDFLRRVFELQEGEVGAALNHDQSIAYVVRVVEHQDSLDELRTAYLAEANTWEGLGLKRYEHSQRAASNLVVDVGTNVKWEREPDQFSDEEAEPEAED